MNELKKYLFDKYNGFADKRVKNLDLDRPFDIKLEPDVWPHACSTLVWVRSRDKAEYELDLFNLPIDITLRKILMSRGGIASEGDHGAEVRLHLGLEDILFIRNLAIAIGRITARGSYKEPNWFWMCRKVADSLEKFADNLLEFAKSQSTQRPPTSVVSRPPAEGFEGEAEDDLSSWEPSEI